MVYLTAQKTPTRTTLFGLVYGNSCHLPVELEHIAYWFIKVLNLDFKATGEKGKLQPSELEQLRLDAYENTKMYKKRTEKWHDKRVIKNIF